MLIQGIIDSKPKEFLSFTTEAQASAFDPTFTVGSGILRWDLGDASVAVKANDFSHTYAAGGVYR